MRFFAIIIAAAGIAAPALSENPALEGQIITCSAFADPAERLACFDALAGAVAGKASRAPQRPAGSQWVSRSQTSQIDDSEGWTLTAYASSPVYTSGRNYKPELIIRCQENTTDIFVQYDEFIDRDGTRAEIRLDASPAQSAWWQTSNDGVAVGQWGGARSIPVIRQLFDHEKLTIRVEQFSGPPITTSFNITGLRQEVAPLSEACHWSP